MLHTVSKGIKEGEFVLCPDGSGNYKVGRVTGVIGTFRERCYLIVEALNGCLNIFPRKNE